MGGFDRVGWLVGGGKKERDTKEAMIAVKGKKGMVDNGLIMG